MSSVILLWTVTLAQVALAGAMGWHYTGSCADRGRRIASLVSIRCTSTPCSSFLSSASAPAAHSISKPRWSIAVFGFVATVALAKFLMRGEVIE